MANIDDLRTLAQQIKNETNVGANTANRVGTTFEKTVTELETHATAAADEAIARAAADANLQEQIDNIHVTIDVDNVPTKDSDNPVSSGGVYDALEEVNSQLESDKVIVSIDAGESLFGSSITSQLDYLHPYPEAVTVSRIVFSKEHLDKIVNRQTATGLKCFVTDSALKITQVVTFTLAANSYEAAFDDVLNIPEGGYLGFSMQFIGKNSQNQDMRIVPFVNTSAQQPDALTYWAYTSTVAVGYTLSMFQKQQYMTGYTVYVKDTIGNKVEQLSSDVEEVQAIVGKNSVGIDDATNCLVLGSSLTDDYHSPRGLGWCDRLNDLVDVNILNGGWTGTTLLVNIQNLQKGCVYRDYSNLSAYRKIPYKVDYLWLGNTANSTAVGKVCSEHFDMGRKVADELGAKMLIATENPMTYSGRAFDQHRKEYGRKHNVPVSAMCAIASKLKVNTPYAGFSSGVHGGYRANAFFLAHYDLLSRLAIEKSVKLFRVRPDYQAGAPTVAQLAYDGNVERARLFSAIGAGCGAYVSTGAADNRDNESYAVPSDTPPTLVQEEFTILKGGSLSFDKFCLAEFILDRIHVTEGTFTAEMSVQPTAVYIATKKQAYSGTCSEWVEITNVQYADGVVTADFLNKDQEIEAFDKVRILVYYAGGAFTLNKPTLRDYDGTKKVAQDLLNDYHHRQYGEELNGKTSCEDGWTLTNASVKSLPTEIANYSGYNDVKSHVELLNDNGTMTKTINVSGAKRVAVRVVANLFPKIATTRTFSAMTAAEKTEYISDDAPTVVEGGYNYGTLTVGVGSDYGGAFVVYEEFLMQPGWLEYYLEMELTDESEIPVTIGRRNAVDGFTTNSDFKVFVHDVSVQKIL